MSVGDHINVFNLTLEVAFKLATVSTIAGALLGLAVLGYYAVENANLPSCLRFSSQLPEIVGFGATALLMFIGVATSHDELMGFILIFTTICSPFLVGVPIYYLRTFLKTI